MEMGMMGTLQILWKSHGDGNRCSASPTGMETSIMGLPQGCVSNVVIKMRFTVMQLLLCLQWQKIICQQLF